MKPTWMYSPACLENKTPELSRKRIQTFKLGDNDPGRQCGLYCCRSHAAQCWRRPGHSLLRSNSPRLKTPPTLSLPLSAHPELVEGPDWLQSYRSCSRALPTSCRQSYRSCSRALPASCRQSYRSCSRALPTSCRQFKPHCRP